MTMFFCWTYSLCFDTIIIGGYVEKISNGYNKL